MGPAYSGQGWNPVFAAGSALMAALAGPAGAAHVGQHRPAAARGAHRHPAARRHPGHRADRYLLRHVCLAPASARPICFPPHHRAAGKGKVACSITIGQCTGDLHDDAGGQVIYRISFSH